MIEIELNKIEYQTLHTVLAQVNETKEAKVTASKVIGDIVKAVREKAKGNELPETIILTLEKYELGNLYTGFTKLLELPSLLAGDIQNLKALSQRLKFSSVFDKHLEELGKSGVEIELDVSDGFAIDA